MKAKNRGFIVPLAIGVLVVASVGLLFASWWGNRHKGVANSDNQNNISVTSTTTVKTSSANDDKTLDSDSANIDAQIKGLDNSNSDINGSLNDSSSI